MHRPGLEGAAPWSSTPDRPLFIFPWLEADTMQSSKDRVISLRRPWASLILAGLKSVETRSWNTHVRGRLYIHVSQQPAVSYDEVALPPQDCPPMLEPGYIHGYVDVLETTRYSLIGEFMMDRDLHLCRRPPEQLPIYGWKLINPVTIEPIPCKGQLRIFRRDLDGRRT